MNGLAEIKQAAMTRLISQYATKLIVDWPPDNDRRPSAATVQDAQHRLARCAKEPKPEMYRAICLEVRRQYEAGEASPWWHGEPGFEQR